MPDTPSPADSPSPSPDPHTPEPPAPEVGAQLAALRRALRPVAWPLAGAAAVETLAAVASVAPALITVDLAAELLRSPADRSTVWTLALALVGCLVVHALCSSLALILTHLIDGRHQWRLRTALAAKLGRLPLGWFSAHHAGQVKKMLQDDTHAIHYVVAHAILDLVSGLVVPLLAFGYLFSVDWRLALVTLALPLTYFAVFGALMARNPRAVEEQARSAGVLSGRVVEIFDGIQVIRAFGKAGSAHRRYTEAVDDHAARLKAWMGPLTRVQAAITVLLQPITFLLVVLVTGAAFLTAGWIEPLTLLPFLLLALTMGTPVVRLGNGASALQEAAAAALRLRRTEELPEVAEPARPGPRPVGPQEVVFSRVSFGYGSGRDAVTDVSFRLTPGTVTALVGPSGAGKSTLAKLLPRFYDPGSGEITLGGVPVTDLATADLYRTVGFVFQDVRLLHASVGDNIRLGRPEATDAQVRAVAEAASIHQRILALPRGYDSVVGEDARFSGGEAQRVAIARALLADAPVLVLDEATAMVDPESEAAIQRALSVLAQGRTVLMIAHRLHTVTGVDRILVVDDGRVVQSGTHAELSAADGLYRRMWEANERSRDHLGQEAAA
ncbi:ABC transporter ATP-binding protein [Streptomyces sp. NPDC004610]|uniref:ABC transporter ATP-binding protein n=1 Tax=unclassified Streptomyces TaxID=2593676 RepID=UPI0033BF8512